MKSFGTVRQHFFCRKLCYPLLGIKFFDTRNFLKHRKVPTPTVSSTVRPKKSIGKFWYSSLLIHKLFRSRKISDNKNRMIPLRSFSVLRGKKVSTENCATPSLTALLIQKIHQNLKFCEEQKGSSTKVFGIFRQKIFDGKFWYSPLFIQKLSRYRTCSETQHRRIPLRKLSALWDKKFSVENLDILPFDSKTY